MQQTLTEKSYQHIREKLGSGQLGPGQQLVTRKLAEEMGVSLGPVREAIHRLASEGLVRHVPGAGAFVCQMSPLELEELYLLRDAVESCAAGQAAKYITTAQLEELESIVAGWGEIAEKLHKVSRRQVIELFHRWLDNEQRFHEVIMEAARNQLLAKVIREYRAISQIFEAQRHAPELLTHEVAQRTFRDRQRLMRALRKRDSETARSLMSQQIQLGCKTVVEFFRGRGRVGAS